MSTLKQKAESILAEKNNKILSSKIKKDWQIFDVIGNYEGSGGGDIGDYFNLELSDGNRKIVKQYPTINTDNLTNFDELFFNQTSDIIPNLTSMENAISANNLFYNARNITELPSWLDTSNVENMNGMCYCCAGLTDCSNVELNFENANQIIGMFESCTHMVTAPTIINLEERLKRDYRYMEFSNFFSNCERLENIPEIVPDRDDSITYQVVIGSFYNMIQNCSKLSHQSLLNVLKLIGYANSTYSLTSMGVSPEQYLDLSNEELNKYVTRYGWVAGYEDYKHMDISNNLYDEDGETIITNDIKSLIEKCFLYDEEINLRMYTGYSIGLTNSYYVSSDIINKGYFVDLNYETTYMQIYGSSNVCYAEIINANDNVIKFKTNMYFFSFTVDTEVCEYMRDNNLTIRLIMTGYYDDGQSRVDLISRDFSADDIEYRGNVFITGLDKYNYSLSSYERLSFEAVVWKQDVWDNINAVSDDTTIKEKSGIYNIQVSLPE